MDYEKKYKDALEKAKEVYNRKDATDGGKLILESMFHELKESEDEKIRKDLINFVDQYGDNYYGQVAKAYAISWLEKQGERKPAWSEEDEEMRKKLLFLMKEENNISSWGGCYEWLKSLVH